MNRLTHKITTYKRRKNRVQKSIKADSALPRLSVNISNHHVSAQIVDDSKHHTLALSTTVGNKKATGTMTEKAKLVGADIAKKAQAKKVKKVVFDRSGKLYHGRIKALADAAREAGLEF